MKAIETRQVLAKVRMQIQSVILIFLQFVFVIIFFKSI